MKTKSPRKPHGTVTFSMPIEWMDRLRVVAEADDRAINKLVQRMTIRGIRELEIQLGIQYPPSVLPEQQSA